METTSLRANHKAPQANKKKNSYDMVVFCHLRWDFVYQRPQHIISRFARDFKVLFIEEPYRRENEQTSRLIEVSSTLHVLQPNVSGIEEIKDILPQYVNTADEMIGWFYSPSFVPLLSSFNFGTVVYDCMDELSLFKGAPASLIEQEQRLVAEADIVFTGGKSLYESKARLHRNVHCFPSSVDQAHFSKALNGIAIPSDIGSIQGPIAGYFGVIDERIDLELLAEVAEIRKDIAFVMIGPLAKIGEHDLPKRDNIHYLGMKDYKELPAYIKAFDFAMMPFALNDATKYISPTKTLEYMAAHRPIISTAIKDVVRDYSHCISIIASPTEFAEAIDVAMEGNPSMTNDYTTILNNTSWDATVVAMQACIKEIAQ